MAQSFPQNTSSLASPTAMRWTTGQPDRNTPKVKTISSLNFAENKYRKESRELQFGELFTTQIYGEVDPM